MLLGTECMTVYKAVKQEADAAAELNMTFVRAGTVGTHPRFIAMLRKLIQERLSDDVPREAIGRYGPNWDMCPVDCCPAPAPPGQRPPAAKS